AAEILVDWMKERGYLSARLVTINTVYASKSKMNKSEKSVRLLIYLHEGDQTQIQSISITGAKVLSEQAIKNMLRIREGAALNLFGLTNGIEELKKVYQEDGYLSFRILNEGTDDLVRYSQENRVVDITLNLEEGSQYKVSRIELEGLEKTKDFVVRRELSFKEGDILSNSELEITERKLRRLGIFSTVALRVVDDPGVSDGKVVKISLHEADRGVISGGPGYRNDLGIRAFGQLAYTNLWGEDHTGSINLAVNRRFYNYNFLEGQVQLAYAWPWFAVPELYFRPLISFGATQYINFAARTLTIAANWQKQLVTRPNLIADFSYTFESINQFQSIRVGDDQQMTIGSVTPKFTLDMRDSALLPTSGLFTTASFDYAMPFMGARSDIGYYRFQFRTDYYFPLPKNISLYLSFRTGYEETLEPLPSASGSIKTDSIPLIKQFALGGIGSIRGYQLQELNFQGKFTGKSLSYVNYRSELDLPFAGALRLALFVDAGNLLIDQYSFGFLQYGAGFGFHYITPVGPVSLDYGLKIAPKPGTDASVIHFSVGII
ncbi:MAG: BamA/TamA family outer membrane protein, partial [Bdellovibrionia bacterium]